MSNLALATRINFRHLCVGRAIKIPSYGLVVAAGTAECTHRLARRWTPGGLAASALPAAGVNDSMY